MVEVVLVVGAESMTLWAKLGRQAQVTNLTEKNKNQGKRTSAAWEKGNGNKNSLNNRGLDEMEEKELCVDVPRLKRKLG